MVACAVIAWITPAANAEDCVDSVTSAATADFVACDAEFPVIDYDTALSYQTPIKSGNEGAPWIAQRDKGVPLTVNSSPSGVSLRTSLDDLRTFNTQSYTLDSSGSGTLALPKAAMRAHPLDVWTNVDVNGYQGDRDQSTRAGLGVDYKLSRAAVVGVSVERGDARSGASGTTEDSKASAYLTLQATPLISIDARTQWQAGNAEFAAANGAAEKSAFILAPKINHSFALGDGKAIAPFLTYKREFDMSSGPMMLDTPERSAGAGITYTDADAYTLSVTTDIDSATAASPQSVSSKFKLSVPIN